MRTRDRTTIRVGKDIYKQITNIYKITGIPRSTIVDDILRRSLVSDDVMATIDKYLQSSYEERLKK